MARWLKWGSERKAAEEAAVNRTVEALGRYSIEELHNFLPSGFQARSKEASKYYVELLRLCRFKEGAKGVFIAPLSTYKEINLREDLCRALLSDLSGVLELVGHPDQVLSHIAKERLRDMN